MTPPRLEAVRQETPLSSHHHQIFKPTCVCTHVFLHHFCQNENRILAPIKGKAFYLCSISYPFSLSPRTLLLVILTPLLHHHVLLFLILPVSKDTWSGIYHLNTNKTFLWLHIPTSCRPICSMTHWNLWKELPSFGFSLPIHSSTLSNVASITTLLRKLLLSGSSVTFSNCRY